MNRVILYHGSSYIIEKPEFGKGNYKNDYGLGFYTTEDVELAKEWAVTETNDGYVNKYEIDLNGLKILNLSDSKYYILNWIAILLENRTFALKNDIAKIGKKYLIENFLVEYEDYDVIIGYRADDSYFSFAEAFLNNSISSQRLGKAMKLGNLGEQVVIKSEKAFNRLNFIGYEKVDSSKYYPLRKERNDKAREAFLSDKEGIFNKDALYLNEIIRGGIKDNDPRL